MTNQKMSPEDMTPLLDLMSVNRADIKSACACCSNNPLVDSPEFSVTPLLNFCQVDWKKMDSEVYQEIEEKYKIPCVMWSPA